MIGLDNFPSPNGAPQADHPIGMVVPCEQHERGTPPELCRLPYFVETRLLSLPVNRRNRLAFSRSGVLGTQTLTPVIAG